MNKKACTTLLLLPQLPLCPYQPGTSPYLLPFPIFLGTHWTELTELLEFTGTQEDYRSNVL